MTVLIDQTFKRPSFEYSIVRILFGVTCQSVRDTSSAFTHHYLMTCMISYKYRPKEKPVVMGIYEVERIVSKRNQGSKAEYFIQWKNYPSTENTREHDVLRAIFPGMPSVLRESPYLERSSFCSALLKS